jgi:hypothetical protein
MTRGRRNKEFEGYCDHPRAGIVTNQPDGYDPNRNHAAASVCASPTCRARALAWVQQTAGEPGVYLSDTRKGGPRDRRTRPEDRNLAGPPPKLN